MDPERYIQVMDTSQQQQQMFIEPIQTSSSLIVNNQVNQEFHPTATTTYQTMSLTNNPMYQSQVNCNKNDDVIVYHVGGSYFKKVTIYSLLFLVLITVIINSTLIIWIISSVNLSSDGIGRIRFPSSSSEHSYDGSKKNLEGKGESFLHQQLYANHILSPQGKTLRIISSNGIWIDSKRPSLLGHHPHGNSDTTRGTTSSSLDTLNSSSTLTSSSSSSRLFLTPSSIGSTLSQLVIRSPDGKLLLMVDEEGSSSNGGVHLAIDRLRVNNENGMKLNCSIQTPLVKSSSNDLRMESLTRSLDMFSPKHITISTTTSSFPLSFHPSSSPLSLPSFNPSLSPSTYPDNYQQQQLNYIDEDEDTRSEIKRSKVSFKSLNHVSFKSKHGQITINSSSVYLESIPMVFPTKRGKTYPGINGLCSCPQSGQFFMIPPDDSCNDHTNYCRLKVE